LPTLIFIAGPNGAGKTTFAREYLSEEERRFEFVNADEMARGLVETGTQAQSDILAARMMLSRVDELVEADADFVVETTLASLTYARKIPGWRQRGYVVSLAYLRLSSVSESIARVQKGWKPAAMASPKTRSGDDSERAFVLRNDLQTDRR
jgi:predicted ABC-type ATPase